MRTRTVVYVVIACLASALQFRFYDCSGLPALSFGGGALTVLVALLVIDRVYLAVESEASRRQRVARALGFTVGGGCLTFALAAFTIVTHMCG